LSILECQAPRTNPKPPAETQSPPIENFLATVLFTTTSLRKKSNKFRYELILSITCNCKRNTLSY